LLHENSARTLKELADSLKIGKSIVYAMGKIQKEVNEFRMKCLKWLFKIV